jgi:hypothetical protein
LREKPVECNPLDPHGGRRRTGGLEELELELEEEVATVL